LQKHFLKNYKNESLFPPLQCLSKHPVLNSVAVAQSFLASLCSQKTISYNIIVKGPLSALAYLDRVWKSKRGNNFDLVKYIYKVVKARHWPF